MGMDVIGQDPTSKSGEYFGSTVRGWYPLQAAMIAAGWVEAVAWGSNDGLGLPTAAVCDRLADRLSDYLRRHPEVDCTSPVPQAQRNLERALARTGLDNSSYVPHEQVRSFIAFLRSCGGFKIR